MALDLSKLSDEELQSIASGDLKSLPEETLRLISGAQPPAGSVAPSPIVSGPETAKRFQTEADAKRAAIVQGFEESSKKDATTNPMTMEGVLTSTPALVTGAALLGALTTYVAPKVYKSVKERFMASPVQTPVRIDPIGFESFADMTPAPTTAPAPTTSPAPNPLGQTNLTPEDLQARAAQTRAAITPAGAPDVPPQFSPGPVSPAGNIPPAPAPSSGPNSSITTKVTDTVSNLIDEVDAPKQPPGPTVESFARDANGNVMWPEKMSPASRAGAEAFMKQYPNHAEALAQEGRFGILGAGAGDNNLYNAYGPDLRRRLLAEVNQGQPVGPYGNYVEKVNPAIQALPPESSLGKELADMRVNQPKSANRGSLGLSGAVMPDKMTMGPAASKALKAGGKAFLGVAIADAANAANKGDYVGAAKIMGPALDPTGTLEAAINPESTARSLTSVSPIIGILSQIFGSQAKAEADKAYADKVGGGRGLTPASAYQR